MTRDDAVRQSNAHYRLGLIKEKMADAHAAAAALKNLPPR